ncbi:MAG: hypothetical protein ACYDBW_09515 [Sulfuricaulis sp.]
MFVLKNRFDVRVIQPAPKKALIAVLDATTVKAAIPAGGAATRMSIGVIAGKKAAANGRAPIDLGAAKNVPVPLPISQYPYVFVPAASPAICTSHAKDLQKGS